MITEKQYIAINERVEELLKMVTGDTPEDDRNSIELEVLSNLIADYEDVHYPIEAPELKDVLRLRMQERNLTQEKLADLVGIPPSRLSMYFSGKAKPTYNIAKTICTVLNIHPAIVLGLKDELNYSY